MACSLPEYDAQLSGFHRAFEGEPPAVIGELPPRPGLRALDLACGDGFYTRRIEERLGLQGSVTGVDLDPALWVPRTLSTFDDALARTGVVRRPRPSESRTSGWRSIRTRS
jgi:trans-aconitate methyltransferase